LSEFPRNLPKPAPYGEFTERRHGQILITSDQTHRTKGVFMGLNLKVTVAALVVAATAMIATSPADAQWRGRHHHHGYYGGGAALGGFAAGAIIGGALAAQRPYYYAPGPVYGGGDADAYCFSRFRSYDPGSGTYLGYDGLRHPCP
jgi:hypothetical protein